MANTGPIPAHINANFQTLLRAAEDGRLALLSCLDAKTGEPRYVLVAVSDSDDPETVNMVPFGHLCTGNPYEEYTPPSFDDDEPQAEAA